jgi:Na+/proline symporter
MNPILVTGVIVGYFLVLVLVARWVSRPSQRPDQLADFAGFKSGIPWFVVAFGMIGTSLSGVTFISVPGDVGALTADVPHQPKGMTYFQIVIGYLLGYVFIALVLLPLYYRQNNRSIYSNLEHRLGNWAPRVAAGFFMVARLFGSSVRLFLTLSLLYTLFYSTSFIAFEVFAALSLMLIYLYSSKSGLNTIVWTDTIQTLIFLSVLLYLLVYFGNLLGWNILHTSRYTQLVEWDIERSHFVGKSLLAGFLICVAMTGLDQDMIQKSLMCKSLRQAQLNLLVFAGLLLVANLLFLLLGVLLYEFAAARQLAVPQSTDLLLPEIMIQHLDRLSPLLLLLGLVSSSASSVDGTIAALSTTYTENFSRVRQPDRFRQRMTYLAFAALILLVIIAFHYISGSNTEINVITLILSSASFIYAPIVGLFLLYALPGQRLHRVNGWSFGILVLAAFANYGLIRYANSVMSYQIGFESIAIGSVLAYLALRIQSFILQNKIQDQK